MTRTVTAEQLKEAQRRLVLQSGGSVGLRDEGALEAAVAQPAMTFGGQDLYPTIPEKAAALAFSLIKNHPFIDGNKRAAHAGMELFLVMNGYELIATTGEQEQVMLSLAAGETDRDDFTEWVLAHVTRSDAGR